MGGKVSHKLHEISFTARPGSDIGKWSDTQRDKGASMTGLTIRLSRALHATPTTRAADTSNMVEPKPSPIAATRVDADSISATTLGNPVDRHERFVNQLAHHVVGARQQQFDVQQLHQIDLPLGHQCVGGADKVQLSLEQGHKGQAVHRLAAIQDRHVHATVHDQLAQRGAEILVQVKQYVGVARPNRLEQGMDRAEAAVPGAKPTETCPDKVCPECLTSLWACSN